jgi:hypothetical protein
MGPEAIRNPLRRQPFRPFHIHMNNGATYDIRHPEMARVDLREVTVATKMTRGFIDEKDFLNIRNIPDIELLNEAEAEHEANS